MDWNTIEKLLYAFLTALLVLEGNFLYPLKL